MTRNGEAMVYAWAGQPLAVAPQPRARVIELGRQIASAVGAMHVAGIGHFAIRNSHVVVAGDHARKAGARMVSHRDPPWLRRRRVTGAGQP